MGIKKELQAKSERQRKRKQRNFFRNLAEFTKKRNKIPTRRTSHVLGNISNTAADHSKFQSGSKMPREI